MTFKKINSYTWVLDDGKSTIENRMKMLDEQSISKSKNFLKEKKYRRPEDQEKLYRKFITEVFRERNFISSKEFNNLIKDRFSDSTTWYRNRMLELGLITENNKLIKPKIQTEN